MASHIVTSIGYALKCLEQRHKYIRKTEPVIILMHKLRGLRTFLLCSGILRRAEDKNDKLRFLRGFLLCSRTLNNNVATDITQGSLFVQIEGVVSAIINIHFDRLSRSTFDDCFSELEVLEEDIDKEYTDLLQLSPSSPVQADQVKDILDSVVENLDDFLSLHRPYVGILVQPMEALREYIKFWGILFGSSCILQRAEDREFQCLLSLIQNIAISAGQLTTRLFSEAHYNADAFSIGVGSSTRSFCYDGIMSMTLALQLKTKPADNPLLHETYCRALASLESSRELYKRTLNSKDCIFMLSSLWEILQFDYPPVVSLKDKLQALYEGLRFLTDILEKKPNMLVLNILNITMAAVYDAKFILFSLFLKDFIIDHQLQEFLEKVKVIRTEIVEDQASVYIFPKTNMLGFLNFLLSDYLLVHP